MLTRGDLRFDPELRGFLSRAYDLKAIADYETGLEAEIPVDRAEAAIALATRFVEGVVRLLE